MKHALLDILACPEDKSSLELSVINEANGEVIEGILTCKECGTAYAIENAIPNLLPKRIQESNP